jgi:hypothetical protein
MTAIRRTSSRPEKTHTRLNAAVADTLSLSVRPFRRLTLQWQWGELAATIVAVNYCFGWPGPLRGRGMPAGDSLIL